MLFNSLAFATFLPIVFILYWQLPHKYRWILLLAASYYFYMSWNVKYVVLILFTTLVSYLSGILLEKGYSHKRKKVILATAAILSLSVLFFFKYFNFISDSAVRFFSLFAIQLNPWTLDLLLPVGISFYTFQTLGYVIDVYKGDVKAERHFGYYATFISFFPQLVAGPIERTKNLMPQIKAVHKFDYEQATYGLKLMAWGFFKKIVIADTLSKYVSKVYGAPHEFQGFALVLATVFFALQIYCDFSGYSDIAIGTAKLMGIDLMTNFRSPYFSQSVKEFWSRWHISLSTWFRDYVYIPLGGNRVGQLRHAFNLMITFLVSGLWHGANWTFVAWGGVHGAALVLENKFIPKKYQATTGFLRWIKIFVIFVFCSFGWIFFVSHSIADAMYVIHHALDGIRAPIAYVKAGFVKLGIGRYDRLFLAIPILVLLVFDYYSLKEDVIKKISSQKVVVRWFVYVVLLLAIIMNFTIDKPNEFIYFQF